MQSYEYRAVPAPRRGVKVRGVKGEEARFAAAVEGEMNRLAGQGWEYVRSDTLPCDERQGWFGGRTTVFRTLMVFRRATADAAEWPAMPPEAAAVPSAPAPVAARAAAPRLALAERLAGLRPPEARLSEPRAPDPRAPASGRAEPRLVGE